MVIFFFLTQDEKTVTKLSEEVNEVQEFLNRQKAENSVRQKSLCSYVCVCVCTLYIYIYNIHTYIYTVYIYLYAGVYTYICI